MNHVKKLVLVPHESVARLHDSSPTSAQEKMGALDTEMKTILNKQYADDAEKWKVYSEALQRYLHFADDKRKPVSLELKTEEEKQNIPTSWRAQIASLVPRTYKDAALRIFDYLGRDGSPLTVDTTGVVSINGTPLSHSNIVDLISDLTRSRKNVPPPPGSSSFVQALAGMNIPLELIGNEIRKNEIQQLKTLRPAKKASDGEKKKRRSRQPSPNRNQTGSGRGRKKRTATAKTRAPKRKAGWAHW